MNPQNVPSSVKFLAQYAKTQDMIPIGAST